MTKAEQHLMNGEEILHRQTLHWAIFLPTLFWSASAIGLLGMEARFAGLSILLFLIAATLSISAFISYRSSSLHLTNRRLIARVGFLRWDCHDLLLSHVESVQVRQGLIGRNLGFGSVIINAAGGARIPLHKVAAPERFRRKLQEQLARSARP